MKKRGFYLIAFFLLSLVYYASSVDYTVTRTVNTTQVVVDGTVEVSLYVDVGNPPNMADAYAIDDVYPSGWTVVDPGSGSTNHTGHIKWVVVGISTSSSYSCSGLDSCVDPMQDVTYRYILQAPSSPETATISGKYMFDVQSSEQNTGSTTIEVIDNAPNECSAYDGDQSACTSAPEDCAWCPLNSNCEPTANVKCTASGCINSTHLCTSNCIASACGSNKICNTSSDSCETVTSSTGDDDTTDTTSGSTTCTSDWEYGAWTDCVDGTRTRTKTDKNGCESTQTETSRCRESSTTSSGTTTGESTTTTRTRGDTTTTTQDTATGTTRTNTRDSTRKDANESAPKTTEEVLDENAKTTDKLFYIVLSILIVMGIIIFLYFKKRNILFNPSSHTDLSSQKKMIQGGQQPPGQDSQPALNRWKPM